MSKKHKWNVAKPPCPVPAPVLATPPAVQPVQAPAAESEHEAFLRQQMTEAEVRLARIRCIETALLDAMLGEVSDTPEAKLAQVFLNGPGDPVARLQRYANDAERSYYQAHKALLASQAARRVHTATRAKLQDRHDLDKMLGTSFYGTKPNTNHAPAASRPQPGGVHG